MLSLRKAVSARTRVLAGAAVALFIHASGLVALRAHARGTGERSADDAEARRADARRERAALLRTAEADLAAGRVTLGETLIALGWIDGIEESTTGSPPDPADRARALATYRVLFARVRDGLARGESIEGAIVDAVAEDGHAGRYKRMYPRLSDALAHGGGNCVALSTLATALAYDAGHRENAALRVYANHVAPEVGTFHFGMVKRCHGPGVKLAARDLIGAYAKARATSDHEPFAFPHAEDACDDPGEVFGDLQLVADDPPASSPAAAAPSPSPSSSGAPSGAPSGSAGPSARVAATPPECRRRTVLEEYEDDVEAIGADGRTLGGVAVPRAASLDLAGHATSAACLDARADALSATSDPETLVLALGDAAMAAEEAARVFAAAGELDVAREYERRLAAHRARAAVPLERVIARLGDPEANVAETLAGAGRLVALGEGGRTAMLLASERHRGFWELANLMTRPSSQLGAVKRWSEKPIDVRLDVVDALPCASETFLAQLDAVDLRAARALRGACEVRARIDKQTCVLDEALAHARAHAVSTDPDAVDLAEAVLVRHLSARCRGPAFNAAARRWSQSKPAPIAKALASRLVDD
jgi:hypothetical protein